MRTLPKRVFEINQKIEIAPPGNGKFYKTVILDLTGNTVYVSVPTEKGKHVIPAKGDKIEGRMVTGDAYYTFSLTMLGLKIEDRVPMLILEKPRKVVRHQRRTFYRCPAILDMEYTESETGISWRAAKTLDIGGGGVRFVTDEKLAKGTELIIKIYIAPGEDEKNIITLCGEVVRTEKHTDSTPNIYSVNFTDVSEAERDRLINFAFSLMSKRIY